MDKLDGGGTKLPAVEADALPENTVTVPDPEVAAFIHRLQTAPAPATTALCVAIAALFVLELALGATDQLWLLSRLGALTTSALESGEAWRLLSSTFLHGGFMHAGFALVILWNLGGFVERSLGTARLLSLYTLSGLAGGVAALFFGGGLVTVGSSGGLWGLLVAQAVLAFRPGGALPPAVAEAIKPAATKNLGLNVLVSFLPGVSLAAHAGGGLVGLLLVGSGLLTRGLAEGRRGWRGRLHLGVAVTLAPLYALSIGWALAQADLPTLLGDPEPARYPLGVEGLSLRLPAALTPPPLTEDGELPEPVQLVVVYGDFWRDPYSVEVYVTPGEWTDADKADLTDAFEEPFLGALDTTIWAPEEVGPLPAAPEGAMPARSWRRFEAPNGAAIDSWSVDLGDRGVAQLVVTRWPELGGDWATSADAAHAAIRVDE